MCIGFKRLIWVSFSFQKFTYENSRLKELTSTKIQAVLSIYCVPGRHRSGREEKVRPHALGIPCFNILYIYHAFAHPPSSHCWLFLFTYLSPSVRKPLLPQIPFPSCLNLVASASRPKTTSSSIQLFQGAVSLIQWVFLKLLGAESHVSI